MLCTGLYKFTCNYSINIFKEMSLLGKTSWENITLLDTGYGTVHKNNQPLRACACQYMPVCACTSMLAHMQAHMHTRMHARTHTHAHTHPHTVTCVPACVYACMCVLCVHVCAYMCTCMHGCESVCMCVYCATSISGCI